MTPPQLSPEAVRFRRLLIDALWTDNSGGYISADHFVGQCPICHGPVGVRFAGLAPRATLRCHNGCSEAEIATRLQDVREVA